MTVRHRIGLLVVLLVALAGLVVARPTPSSAAEICNRNVLLNGYKLVQGPWTGYSVSDVDNSASISVWLRKSDRAKMVLIVNYVANGKSGFQGAVTDTSGRNLGATRNLPAGKMWCSSLTKASYISGFMDYRRGNASYFQSVFWGP